MRYQLAKNQSYWREQQHYLKDYEQSRLKIEHFQRTVGLANRFCDKLTNHHVFASSRDLAYLLSNFFQTSQPDIALQYKKEYEEFRKKAEQSYLDIRELSIQITEHVALMRIFFNEEAETTLSNFRDKANRAIKPIMTNTEMANRIDILTNGGINIDVAKELITKEYDDYYQSMLSPQNELQIFLDTVTKLIKDQYLSDQKNNVNSRKNKIKVFPNLLK